MSLTRKTELSVLSKEEQNIIALSRHPGLSMLPDGEVEKVRELIETCRDTAQAQALQERKDRRKTKATPGKGTGIRLKTRALATAFTRINKEIARRRADASKDMG